MFGETHGKMETRRENGDIDQTSVAATLCKQLNRIAHGFRVSGINFRTPDAILDSTCPPAWRGITEVFLSAR